MKQLISVSVIAIFLAVSAFTFSTFSMMTTEAQAEGSAWAKLDFGKDLYGLPQVVMFHKRDFAKLDFGEDLYGLPNVADNRDGMGYAMIGYGHDLYGLPNIDLFPIS